MPENEPRTGPEAIEAALAKISAESIEAEARKDLATRKKSLRSSAVKKLRIAEGLKRNNITPSDLLISKVPVVPTKYRPFAAQGESLIPGDANVLYKDLFDIKGAHEEDRKMFGDKNAGRSRLALYDAVKSCYGYGDAVKAKTKQKEITGFLQKIVGRTAKTSYFQQKMMAKTQDNVGRSTITVNPDYMVDEVGVPVELAYTMYAPYIQRRLKRMGFTDAEALKEVKEKSEMSRKALEEEIKVRPVLMSRAPAWHSHSIIAQKPRLVEESAIVINPFVTSGLNADFDGDQMIGRGFVALNLEGIREICPGFYDIYKSRALQASSLLVSLRHPHQDGEDTNQEQVENQEEMKTKETHLFVNDGKQVLMIDYADFPHTTLHSVRKDDSYDIEFYNVPEGVQVPAYDETTGEIVWADVKYWSIHRGKEVEIVRLHNGNEIYTDNDPRAVYGIAMDANTLVPQRFTPTDALNKNVCVPGSKHRVREVTTRPLYFNCNTNELQDTPEGECVVPLDFEFGQFIGLMAGDGWADKYSEKYPKRNRYIHLSDNEGFNGEWMLGYLRRSGLIGDRATVSIQKFKCDEPGRYGETKRHSFYGTRHNELAAAVNNLVDGHGDDATSGSGNKRLPLWYNLGGDEFLLGIVNGLIATDGTVSISYAKGKPQLLIAVTSTSMRLLRELRDVLSALGVSSTIGFSKETIRGNTSWILNVSTTDAKKVDLLSRCCHTRKAEVFTTTSVCVDPTQLRDDYVPFPAYVSEPLAAYIPALKANKKYREAHADEFTDETWAERVWRSGVRQTMCYEVKEGRVTRYRASAILKVAQMCDDDAVAAYEAGKKLLEEIKTRQPVNLRGKVTSSPEEAAILKAAIDSLYTPAETHNEQRLHLNRACDKVGRESSITKNTARELDELFNGERRPYQVMDEQAVKDWQKLLAADVDWTWVEAVEYTGMVETGYDLTVPGYETFMNTDGTILSNTVNLHVPASDRAVKEAMEKLMPSQTPYSDRDGESIVPLPKQEQILGLHTAATAPATPVRQFGSRDEAMAAIRRGEVKLSEDIAYPGMEEDEGV